MVIPLLANQDLTPMLYKIGTFYPYYNYFNNLVLCYRNILY